MFRLIRVPIATLLATFLIGASSIGLAETENTNPNTNPNANIEKQLRTKKNVERWVSNIPNSNRKRFRAAHEIELNNTDSLLKLIEDYDSAPRWIYTLTGAKEIARPSAVERHILLQFEVPWPFYDREALVVGQLQPQTQENLYVIKLKSQNDLAPPSEGRILRIPYFEATLNLELLGQNRAYISLDATADVGGRIPDFLSNMLMRDVPYHTVIKMERLLASGQYD